MMSPESFTIYPARLVFHEDPRGPHYDLFVQVPDQDMLATYELELDAPPVDLANFRLEAGPGGPGYPLAARRKQDHRMHYWAHVGAVAGRGRIDERGRGQLVCADLADQLFLAWNPIEIKNS